MHPHHHTASPTRPTRFTSLCTARTQGPTRRHGSRGVHITATDGVDEVPGELGGLAKTAFSKREWDTATHLVIYVQLASGKLMKPMCAAPSLMPQFSTTTTGSRINLPAAHALITRKDLRQSIACFEDVSDPAL